MRQIFIRAAIAGVLLLPGLVFAMDARQILETAQQRQVERWEGVDAYVVDQTLMNQTVSTWFVRTEYTDDDGELQTFFVPMTATQVQNRQCDAGLSADELDAFASGAEMTGAAMSTEIEDGMEEAGLPKGMLAATGSDPWNTMDPRVMMGGNAEFLRAAADAKRADQAYDPNEDARESLNHMQAFIEKAEVVGTEEISGQEAWHIRAEGLDHVEPGNDGEYRIEAISMYVDTTHFVPLSMKMDGEMTANGKTQPMTLETVQSDYRQVPGSNMYESYRQLMSMSGMLTPEQEAQMAEAQEQLKEFEKQKASMSPQQQAMMDQMMGPQMKMIESMASGNGMQFETVVDGIRVNPALLDANGNPCAGTGKAAVIAVAAPAPATSGTVGTVKTASVSEGDELTLMIQEHLVTLGYDVSPNGELDTATAIAISKYQAENNMAVTGEPSPQLAGILGAEVSSGGAAAEPSPETLQAAQQACLQEKVEAAQAAQKKKRGFGRLMRGVGNLAGQFGNYDIARTTSDIYRTGATADDFSQAAKDLGLTEDDLAECENPL